MVRRPTRVAQAGVVVVALLLVTSPTLGVAGSTDRGAPSVPGPEPVQTGDGDDGDDCVISGSGAAYPGQLDVTCDPERGNASVTIDVSGGWGYVISLNSSSPVTVPESDFGAIDPDSGAGPSDVTGTVVAPGELAVLGPITADSLSVNILEQEWRSHLQTAADKPTVVSQTAVTALPGGSGEAEARYFRSRPSQPGFELDPGVYRAEVTVYETTPPLSLSSGGAGYEATLRDQMARALDNAPRTTGTVTFRVGSSCRGNLDDEEASLDRTKQQQDARTTAGGFSKSAGEGGLSSAETLGSVAASGSSDATMSEGLPDLSGVGPQIVSPLDVARKQQAASEAFQNVEDPPELVDPDGTDGEYGDDVTVSQEAPDLSAEKASDTVQQALAAQGIEPPQGSGLSLEDYVRTDTDIGEINTTEDGSKLDVTQEMTRTALIRLGPNGNVLPKPSALPGARSCTAESETLQKATTWFKIKFISMEGDEWDVATRRRDVATGSIEGATYTGWNTDNPDLQSVTESAVEDADPLGEATDGTVPESGGSD